MDPNLQITTETLMIGALFFAIVDMLFVPLLARQIKSEFFLRMEWPTVIVAGFAWFGIWYWAIAAAWEPVYRYVFPAWAKGWLPLLFGLLMAFIALGMWVLASRARLHPVFSFCLLGGTLGVVTHTWAIFRGIVNKPPMLQGASPVAALVIAFFEFAFYWCTILAVSALIVWIMERIRLIIHPDST
ncbi:MAG: hypothetical protein ABIJ39_11930 [Chloroflexota bacterium]